MFVGVAVFVHLITLAIELDITRLAAENVEQGLSQLAGIRDVCNDNRDENEMCIQTNGAS